MKASLLKLCRDFISDNHISCPETVYQTDRVSNNSLEFIEEICNLVGFCKDSDEDATP